MDSYPVFLHLQGRSVLLVGGGNVASAKIGGLIAAGARVTVVAPAILDSLRRPGVRIEQREFVPEDLEGTWFVVAAATAQVNRAVAGAAEIHGVFVNAVDDTDSASAWLGGVFR
ncbi:MAG: uroporphyrinogen-III C-methyltransferase, partial [Deltaproteobacteria bacterium]